MSWVEFWVYIYLWICDSFVAFMLGIGGFCMIFCMYDRFGGRVVL